MYSNSEDYYDVESLHNKLYQNFLDQDYENEYFDVIFYVDGKELFAHGQILAAASPVFNKQLLQNRSKRNEPIQINDYSYDEFYEFIRLIYYDFFHAIHIDSYVSIKIRKYFVIAKLAVVYETERIIEICKNVIPRNKPEEFFEVIEIAFKYSSKLFDEFVYENFYYLTGFDGFINLDKSVIKVFVSTAEQDDIKKNEINKAVYKWAKCQAMVIEEMPKEEKKELILHQIKDIPIEKEDFISVFEENERKIIHVKISSGDKSIIGTFVDDYGIFKYIESDEEDVELYEHGRRCIWDEKNFRRFYSPSTLKKMKGCNWYLLFDRNRKLNIKHKSLIRNDDYLIAEMNEMDDGFIFDIELDFEATATRKM